MPRANDTGSLYLRGRIWWCAYRWEGVRRFESTGTADKRTASSYLAERRRTGPRAANVAAGTVSAYLDGWIAKRRTSGVRNARAEAQWFAMYVKPTIGTKPLESVTRLDVKALIDGLTRTKSEKTGRVLAPRSVLHVYRTLATAFADAVLDGVIAASPCTLKTRKGELPKKRDRLPGWRAEAVYTRAEAEQMLTDTRIPPDRRTFYALQLLAGLRASEACGRCWRDYDPKAQPLGRLTVATQADGSHELRETKTGDVREVPVVPALAGILDMWRREGFPMLFGRHPQPDDPIVPTRSDAAGKSFRQATMMHQRTQEDRERIKLRAVPAAQHAMRACFISQLEAVGANVGITLRATHAPPNVTAHDGYRRVAWADLCREVGKLPIDLSPGAEVIEMRARASGDSAGDNPSAASESTVKAAANGWAQMDSNQHTPRYERGALTG